MTNKLIQTRYKRQPLFLYTLTNNKEPEMLLKVLNKTTWTSSQARQENTESTQWRTRVHLSWHGNRI